MNICENIASILNPGVVKLAKSNGFITGISFMPQKIFLISAFISCILWAISLALILIGIDSIITLFN